MPTPFNIQFGEAIARSGKTKVAVGKALRISHAYVHQIIAGIRRPSFRCILAAKDALGMEEGAYQELLAAYLQEDQDLHAVSQYEVAPFCHQVYGPLVELLLREASRLDPLGLNGKFLTKEATIELSYPWIHAVDVLLDDLKYLGQTPVIRLFLGKPDPGGVGLNYTYQEHGFIIPKVEEIRVPIYPEKKHIIAFVGMIEVPVRSLKQRLALLQPSHTKNQLHQYE